VSKPTYVRFNAEELDWLEAVAAAYGRDRADIIRSAVRFMRAEWETAAPEQRAQMLVGQQREIDMRMLLGRAEKLGINPKDVLRAHVEEKEAELADQRRQMELLETPGR
jgi:hypothetical protein